MYRVIHRLRALLQDLQLPTGTPGRLHQHLLQLFGAEVMGTGATHQDSVFGQQLHRRAVDAHIVRKARIEILLALDQRRRIQHHQIEFLSLCVQFLHHFQGLALARLQRQPVVRGGGFGNGYGAGGAVDAERRTGTLLQGPQAPGAGVAVEVQHPPALGIACQALAIVHLIEEPSGFLALAQISPELEPGFFDLHLSRYFTVHFHLAGQAFELAQRCVIAPDDALDARQHIVDCLTQQRLLRLHAGGGDLHGQHLVEAVDHQTRQLIGLGEHPAVLGAGKQLVAQIQCLAQLALEPLQTELRVGAAAEQAYAQQRMRVDVTQAQRLITRVDHGHQRAGRQLLDRRGLGIDLVGIDPQMPGAHAAVLTLAQLDFRDRLLNVGHQAKSLRNSLR